jgi:hypothetical protein
VWSGLLESMSHFIWNEMCVATLHYTRKENRVDY